MKATRRPLSGKRVFVYFLAFFGLIVGVNSALVTTALRTHTGLVTEHAYEKGLAYNDVVNAEGKQEKLGWKGDIMLRKNKLHFVLRDAQGKELMPDAVRAHMVRPTQDGMDFDVTLKNGKATVSFLQNGLWEIEMFATLGDVTYQQSQRVVVP